MTLSEVLRTAAEMYDPVDSVDLIGLFLIFGLPALIAAAGTIIGIWLTARGQKKGAAQARKMDAKTTEIHEQTVNDHAAKSNMRDDIDEIRNIVRDIADRQTANNHDIRGIRSDVGDLRGADRAGRKDHDDLVRRLNAFIRREHPGADPL